MRLPPSPERDWRHDSAKTNAGRGRWRGSAARGLHVQPFRTTTRYAGALSAFAFGFLALSSAALALTPVGVRTSGLIELEPAAAPGYFASSQNSKHMRITSTPSSSLTALLVFASTRIARERASTEARSTERLSSLRSGVEVRATRT